MKKVNITYIAGAVFSLFAIFYVNANESSYGYNPLPSSTENFTFEVEIKETPLSHIAIKLPTSYYRVDNENVRFARKPTRWCYDEGCDYMWSLYGRGVLYLHSGVQLTLNVADELTKMDNPTIEYHDSDKFDYSWTYKDKYYRYKQLDATGSIFLYAFEVDMDLKDAADVILDSAVIIDYRQ